MKQAADVKNSRILIVDDDTFTRKVVRRVLSNLGYFSVLEAHDGTSAVNALSKGTIDLVITDIEMPGITGVDLVKLIRSGQAGERRDVRVIILTSYSNAEVIKVSLELDINGFLVKPIRPTTTNEKVVKALTETINLKSVDEYAGVYTLLECLPSSKLNDDHVNAAILKEGGDREYYVRLPYSELRPGMSLRQDVLTRTGDVLLTDGHELNVLLINRLQEVESMLQTDAVWVFRPPDLDDLY